MRKKIPMIMISIAFLALMLWGWTAYASTSTSAAISDSVKGTFQSVTSEDVTLTTDNGSQTVALAKSVWVYRNDQKAQLADIQAGDQIELILNSKHQAAYVKASSAPAQTPAPSPAASATPAPTATAEPTSSPIATQQPTAPAGTTAQPSPQPNQGHVKSVYPGLEGIDLNVDGKNFKLHIVQSKGDKGTKYDLSIKPDHSGTIHLKGDEAAQWIQMLLSSIDLQSAGAEQQIAGLLATHYSLDASKLKVQMKTKWGPQQVQNQQRSDEDDQGEDLRKAEPKMEPKKDRKDETKSKPNEKQKDKEENKKAKSDNNDDRDDD